MLVGWGALTERHTWEQMVTVLEAAESKFRVLAGSVLGESLFWLVHGIFSLRPHRHFLPHVVPLPLLTGTPVLQDKSPTLTVLL